MPGHSRRGPRTPEGRRRASLNAVRHGALSRASVIPGVETEEEWQAHLRAFREGLGPAMIARASGPR